MATKEILDQQEPIDSSSEEGEIPGFENEQKRVWYRSVPFQIAVAGGVSFTAPGMWDALGGLGAGSAAKPVSTYPTSKLRIRNSERMKKHELLLILNTVVCSFSCQCPRLLSLLHCLRSRRCHQ